MSKTRLSLSGLFAAALFVAAGVSSCSDDNGLASHDLNVQTNGTDYTVVKCPILRSQTVTLNGNKTTEVSHHYTTTAELREGFKEDNRSIMKTLEVTVSRDASDNASSLCSVTGLQVIASVPEETANADYFYYKVPAFGTDENSGLCDERGNLKGNTSSARTATTTTFVNIRTANDSTNCVDLEPGQSVTLTVSLPPMVDMNHVQLRVAGAGNTKNVTVSVGNDGTTYTQNQVQTRTVKSESEGNNWITTLDDNIYVQQLSIPGTHDAAASSTTMSNIAKTQSLTLEEQFNMGIRAFDIRPAYRTSKKEMWLWHGFTMTDYSLDNALSMFKTKLAANPGEFVIMQLRHESEKLLLTDKDADKWNEIANALKNYDDIIVQWRPDLTIGECRGKLIIFTRNDYPGRQKAALVQSFPYCSSGEASLSANGQTSKYYVQDYYKYSGDGGAEKLSQMKALYQTTKTFVNSTNGFPWAANYTSGYSGSVGAAWEYIYNAANVNPPFYNYLCESENVGPTGIVFMDYVGSRTQRAVFKYNVYGDLLPQAIINQNYRARLLRK